MSDVEEYVKAITNTSKFYNNAPIGYHSVDENTKILHMNDTELQWLGYSREEIIGTPYAALAHHSVIPEEYKHLIEELKKGNPVKNLPVQLYKKDGTIVHVLITSMPMFDDKGVFTMSRSFVLDVTENKRLEDELRKANEELYHLNQEKNRFIGVASHDLQNPISAIMMTTELLRKTGGNLTDVQRKLLRNIQNSTERMSALIKNILNLNRIERGVIQPDYKLMNVKSCVWDVVNRNMIFAERKKINLSFNTAHEKDLNIFTDCNYFSHIIENLVSNAIKFTHSGKTVEVNIVKSDSDIRINVKDEGQGIKEEEVPLLFHQFEKLSARPTAGEYSTGLGLSIVKEYAQILRGSIEVKSEWEKGSTFTLVIPTESLTT
jgi:PAS domain S-box-containing protein